VRVQYIVNKTKKRKLDELLISSKVEDNCIVLIHIQKNKFTSVLFMFTDRLTESDIGDFYFLCFLRPFGGGVV